MISLILKRVISNNRVNLVQIPKLLIKHEPCSMLSSIASHNNILDINRHSTRFPHVNFEQHRTIYDDSLLDITSLETHQANTRQLIEKDRDECIARIQRYIKTADRSCLLLEDMINLIGLAENEQHLDMIEEFIKLMKDHVDLAGWVAVVTRLYYKMNQVDRAFNNMMDSETFGQVFNTYTSYRVVCTMLFNAGRHEDVLKLYYRAVETLKPKQSRNKALVPGQYPGLALIALASLAKSNLPDATSEADKIYSSLDLDTSLNYNEIRMKAFLAYIAIKNNQPASALNTIATTSGKNYVSLRELKTLALIKLNRFEDILHHLTNIIQLTKGKGVLLSDHYELLEERLGEIENERVQEEITELLMKIKKENLLMTQACLEDILFAPIVAKARPQMNDYNSRQDNNDRPNNNRRRNERRRPYQESRDRMMSKSYLDEDKMNYQ